jgi:hypothetical protein
MIAVAVALTFLAAIAVSFEREVAAVVFLGVALGVAGFLV